VPLPARDPRECSGLGGPGDWRGRSAQGDRDRERQGCDPGSGDEEANHVVAATSPQQEQADRQVGQPHGAHIDAGADRILGQEARDRHEQPRRAVREHEPRRRADLPASAARHAVTDRGHQVDGPVRRRDEERRLERRIAEGPGEELRHRQDERDGRQPAPPAGDGDDGRADEDRSEEAERDGRGVRAEDGRCHEDSHEAFARDPLRSRPDGDQGGDDRRDQDARERELRRHESVQTRGGEGREADRRETGRDQGVTDDGALPSEQPCSERERRGSATKPQQDASLRTDPSAAECKAQEERHAGYERQAAGPRQEARRERIDSLAVRPRRHGSRRRGSNRVRRAGRWRGVWRRRDGRNSRSRRGNPVRGGRCGAESELERPHARLEARDPILARHPVHGCLPAY
jgi:hypothetical protein